MSSSSASGSGLLTSARAFGHFIEQPALIRKIAVGTGAIGLLGTGALVANDLKTAQPGEARRKMMVRDAIILGATGLGTVLATKKFMPLPSKAEAMEEVAKLGETLKNYGEKYVDLLQLDAFKNGKTHLSREEFAKVVAALKERGGKDELNEVLPVGGDMTEVKRFRDQLTEMVRRAGQKDTTGKVMEDDGELVAMGRFFTVGLASVLSGLVGGIISNKVNKVKDPNATANMIKEGCFQFIANIALCAVGASAALVTMKVPPVAKQIAKLGAFSRVVRTAGIMVGLSLGIFGGGVIANILGQRFINPLVDRLNGGAANPSGQAGGKRKIEFADAILHLDDLPTVLALAGFAAVEPILPWFFAFSGYRTAIGYRNDESSKHPKQPASPNQATQQAPKPPAPFTLLSGAPVAPSQSATPLTAGVAASPVYANTPSNNAFLPQAMR
jgi:hypothetical protein